jgi:DNA (cytosine-5)-methyltransferase 1
MVDLVLSLFPGADLLGMAFAEAGFCVVRGPDILLGGDNRDFHIPSRRFDGVIGGPPCKQFSQAIISAKGRAREGNLIPEFNRIVREGQPAWWLMENVPEAPLLNEVRWHEVLDAWHFGAHQHRRRRFSSNLLLEAYLARAPESARDPNPWPCVTATEQKVSSGSSWRAIRQRAGRQVGRRMTLPR